MRIRYNEYGLIEVIRSKMVVGADGVRYEPCVYASTMANVRSYVIACGMSLENLEIGFFELEPGVELVYGEMNLEFLYARRRAA